jgi:hypothetical protein
MMELNYYLGSTLHQLEVREPCPGCGRIDQLAVHDKVISHAHHLIDYWIGCNCGWCGPVYRDPLEAADVWDTRNYRGSLGYSIPKTLLRKKVRI